MSKNTMYTFVSLFVLVLIGICGGYMAVKKIRAKQNQEYPYRWSGKLIIEDVSEEEFKEALIGGAAIDDTIKGLDLVARWNLPHEAAVKEKVASQLTVAIIGEDVSVTFKDKDQTLAQEILTEILMSFDARQELGRKQQAKSQPEGSTTEE